jgi:hypothetical protein
VPVQFSYMQQNPDGSVSTQGAIAERPPTWGELQDHVASTGAALLPATPAEQPPPAAREAAPPPAPAAAPPAPAAAPLLPSKVYQTSGTAPTDINPPRALGSYVLPTSAATLGAYGLPMAATAAMGPLGWPATAGLAVLGAMYGGAGGEYGQAKLERALYGEPPPGAPTPWERAQQFGTTAGETEIAVQVASPLITPIARAVLRPAGSTAVRSAAEAGPLLRTGVMSGERAAVQSGQDVAGGIASQIEAGHGLESIHVGTTAPEVPINTDPLPPLVNATRNALARQGGTPEQLALFDQNMTPIAQGGPQPLYKVLSAERHLNTWAAKMPSNLQLPELNALGTTTRNAISSGVEGTPAAQSFRTYLDNQAVTAPARTMLHQAADAAPEAFQPVLHDADHTALRTIVEQGTPQQVADVGKAWLASTRQAARTAVDPAGYVAEQYNSLPPQWRSAMFGEQTPAFAKLIGEATGPAPPGLRFPVVGTAQVARPWARSVLLSPRAATATSAVRPALTGAGRLGLYTAVEQGTEPKPGSGP